MAKPILSEEEKKRISEAVVEAEKSTSGEIVPLVVRASDPYPGARWRIAVAFMLVVSAAIPALAPDLGPVYLLVSLLPLLGLGHLMALWQPLLRLALGKDTVTEEVRQNACEAFVDLNVHATRDRTGVLIMISLLEHRIEVLADIGIHASAPDGYWHLVVTNLGARIKANDLAGGLADAIRDVGRLLEEKFPARADDTNELPDEVLVRD